MKGWEDWRLILTVPLCVGIVWIITLAFNAAGTVQFAAAVGAFMAAVITAGAVVGQHFLQSKLAINREIRSERREVLNDAIHVSGLLLFLRESLRTRTSMLVNTPCASQEDNVVRLTDKCVLTAAQFRLGLGNVSENQIEAGLERAARLPVPLGHKVVLAINSYRGAATSWNMSWLPDQEQPNRATLNSSIRVAEAHQAAVDSAHQPVVNFIQLNN